MYRDPRNQCDRFSLVLEWDGCMVAWLQRSSGDNTMRFLCARVCVLCCAQDGHSRSSRSMMWMMMRQTHKCAPVSGHGARASRPIWCAYVCVFSLLTCPCPCRRSSLIVVARVARSFMRHPSRRRFPFRNPTQNCLFIDRIAFISFSGTFTHAGLTVCQTIVQ